MKNHGIIIFVPERWGRRQENIAGLCKGSTTDSDSVCEGSNPSPAATRKALKQSCFRAFSFPFPTGKMRPAAAVITVEKKYFSGASMRILVRFFERQVHRYRGLCDLRHCILGVFHSCFIPLVRSVLHFCYIFAYFVLFFSSRKWYTVTESVRCFDFRSRAWPWEMRKCYIRMPRPVPEGPVAPSACLIWDPPLPGGRIPGCVMFFCWVLPIEKKVPF